MRFVATELPGVILVEPTVHRDERGFFAETYHEPRFRENGIRLPFVQDNQSRSARGILRGLHAQTPRWQGKLVRCIEGAVWDVAVDARLGSPHFGRWVGFELSAESFRQLYVPPGFLHGFCVTGEVGQIEYKCTEVYDPEGDFAVRWDDPDLAIAWPVRDPVLSPRDAAAPRLRDVHDRLPAF